MKEISHKMKILILGVNGFIGNALAKELIKKNSVTVYGLDVNSKNIKNLLIYKNFHFKKGYVEKNDKWVEAQIKKCDVIIPLIAIATPKVYVTDPLKVFQLDFESNLKIIKLCSKYKKFILFPSTSEVYGMSNDEKFNEYKTNLVVGPVHKSRWIYSISKQLLDRVIIAYGEQNRLKYTLFRPFNWIGPKLDTLKRAQLGNGRVITVMISNLIKNKNITLVNSGTQKRSFTYLDDGITALLKIINNKNKLNKKIFNIGNPKNNISIKKLSEILLEEYNINSEKYYTGKIVCKTEKSFYGNSYQDISQRVPDISEAKKLLNWEPKTNLKKSIQLTLKSYL